MGKHEAISAAVDSETLADLQRLAEHMDCSVDHLVTTAVLRFVNEEIGAITPDEFAGLPDYVPTEPTARALYNAKEAAHRALLAFLKEGEDDIANGRVISHEDLIAELRSLDDEALAKRESAKKNAA